MAASRHRPGSGWCARSRDFARSPHFMIEMSRLHGTLLPLFVPIGVGSGKMIQNRIKNSGRSAGWLRRGGLWTAAAGLAVLATSGVALASDAAPASGPVNGRAPRGSRDRRDRLG
jgi:hypothetical protein